MNDAEIIQSCNKDIRRLLAEDNENINDIQRDVTSLCRLMPNNMNQLDNLLFKFNEERLKALLALTRSKIVMTDIISLINELRANLEKSSENLKLGGNNKITDKNNNGLHTKSPSPNTSYGRTSEDNRETPSTSLNKTAPSLSNNGDDTTHLILCLRNDLSPQQNKTTIIERKITSNKRKTSGDYAVPTKRSSFPMLQSSIDFYGTDDAILPDVELSRQLQNKQGTGLNVNEHSFNFKTPNKSENTKPTVTITPAQHTGDPDKFKIKKFLESNSANKTLKDQQNDSRHKKINVQESIDIFTNTNRHIPIVPVVATLKKIGDFITLPPIASTLKPKNSFNRPSTSMHPNNEKRSTPISPKNDASSTQIKLKDKGSPSNVENQSEKQTLSRPKHRNSYNPVFTSKCPNGDASSKSKRQKDDKTSYRSWHLDHYQRPSTSKYQIQPSINIPYQGY